ncbi:RagB/SusD family nutrient uptake outer membrane protein [Fulvivirga ligni]|uniref:RagB/SusD family nutrient uptake outer membrane protein n=1 Tax=Fulvivirga ligni TaxID=2904246 RepID=UPI001F325465|nr:RagB/SusD family nutrient uptake outer membrane protein [Fulvivirga ligni]UII19981.1 RagB/SusD family nutrient uptake outer membrane protein [Fulvivirga ligni]
MRYLFIIGMMSLLIMGCKELDLAPENSFTDLNYWTTEDRAQSVLNTAYSQMLTSNYFFYNEALSDNAYNGRGDVAGAASLASGTYDPSLARLKDEWNYHYQGIKTCNILLDNIDRITDMDETTREQMKAEARFIRAFQHFQLMTWWGDVPLLETDIDIVTALTVSRTPREEVLEFILSELEDVSLILPNKSDYAAAENGKITAGAAIALKARVLLYEGNWNGVITECEKLMNSSDYGTYSLHPSYEELFLPEYQFNNEVILSLQYVPQLRTWGEYFDFAPLSTGARLNAMAPTQELVDSYLMLNGDEIDDSGSGYDENDPYSNRDPRLTYTVVYDGYEWEEQGGDSHTIYIDPTTAPDGQKLDVYSSGSSSTTTGYYWRKYYDPTHQAGFASGLNLILIRYADVLLMYAEAKNEVSKLGAADWDLTIGMLRSRAGFTDANALDYDAALSQAEMREVIRNDRRVELAMEGLRIFDIRRWGIAEDVLNGWVHGAQFGPSEIDNGYLRVTQRSFDPSKHYLWPVPRDERNINTNLGQNPNW